MRSLKLSMTTPAICGEQSTTPTATGSHVGIIQSIKHLSLSAFITCSVDGDYTVLGAGTDKQQYAAWLRITSEYYSARGDEQANRYLEVTVAMCAIEWRTIYIDYLIHSMSFYYLPEIAELLRQEHPRYEFSKESYITEMEHVRNIEKRHLMKYDELKAEFEQMEKQKAATGGKIANRTDYIELLLDINKNEGAMYDLSVTVEIFALCLKRLEHHHKIMKEKQAR